MNILFVKLSSIGDIVHTLPALAVVRRAFPGGRLGWIVEKSSAEILRGNPMIDELVEIDTRTVRGPKIIEEIVLETGSQIKQLRRVRSDIALDFQGLLKSALTAKLTGSPRRVGFAKPDLREPASRFLLTGTVEVPSRIHVIRKNLALVAGALSVPVPEGGFEFPIATDESHRNEAEEIAGRAGGPFAIINPAGGWVTKLWPADRFGALADRLAADFGLVPVLTTGPGDDDLAEAVRAASRSGRIVAAKPSLKGFYETARRAAVYVGGDTGPTHLAVAAGCPVVGIFGPTEWWRNGSPRADDVCVERDDIGCRTDCHRRTCGSWICLDIPVETVADAVARRLGR